VGLFYYAGHGLQFQGANFLVPVSADPVTAADVDFELINVSAVLKQMEAAGSSLNVVILDACRNNPFGGRGLRDAGQGLAVMQAPRGTVISYATQPGNVAMDGLTGHSPYTAALADAMRRPGLGVLDAFNQVGLTVDQATGGRQQPWVSISPLEGTFYFLGPTTVNIAPAPSTQTEFWETLSARLAEVTTLSQTGREEAARTYVNAPIHKAMAASTDSPKWWKAYNRPTVANATESALEDCQVYVGHACVLLAVDDLLQPAPAGGKWTVQDMPRALYAGTFDPAQIPGASSLLLRDRSDILSYLTSPEPKAASFNPGGTRVFIITGAADQYTAEMEVLKRCNDDTWKLRLTGPCFLYSVGNRVVLPMRLQEPFTK
jgi:hypothetical protein